MAGEFFGNLAEGLLRRWTMPNVATTAQYTGGYNPGTNGMIDPGVNNNQPVGLSMSPYQIAPQWAKWDAMMNGGRMLNQLQQANIAQGGLQQQMDLANRNTLSSQNDVLPSQLQAIAPDLLRAATSGLAARNYGNQASSLGSILQGGQTASMIPMAGQMGTTAAQATIAKQIQDAQEALNAGLKASTINPSIPELTRSGVSTQLASDLATRAASGLQAQRASGESQFIGSNPDYIAQTMQQPLQLGQAEINSHNRMQLYPGGTGVMLGSDNTPTGTIQSQLPYYGGGMMGNMPHKTISEPTYNRMGASSIIPTTEMSNVINMATPQPYLGEGQQPLSNAGVAPGGVGRATQPNIAPQDIGKAIQAFISSPVGKQQLMQMMGGQQQNTAPSGWDLRNYIDPRALIKELGSHMYGYYGPDGRWIPGGQAATTKK